MIGGVSVGVDGRAVTGGNGVNAGIGARVSVKVREESASWLGPQADTIRLISRASITEIRRLIFIVASVNILLPPYKIMYQIPVFFTYQLSSTGV
jgi:hypothetical protein